MEDDRVIHYSIAESDDKAAGEPSSDEAGGCRVCGFRRKVQRGVVKSCLDCFLNGPHKLFRFDYGVSSAHFCTRRSGSCSLSQCDNPEIVVQRTTQTLDDNNNEGKFVENDNNIVYNNCDIDQSFAVYCKTGLSLRGQALAAKSKVKIASKLIFEALGESVVEVAFTALLN